jgi:hypothetical protein
MRGTVLVVVSAVAAACGGSRDPVERLLVDLEAAAEDRDAGAVLEHLAPGFHGRGGLDRTGAGAELRRYFGLYREVEVEVSEVRVAGPDRRRVSCRIDFSGRARSVPGLEGMLPGTSAYRFELDLVPDGSRRRIVAAAWERLDAPASP